MTCRDMRMSRQIKKTEDTYETDKIKMAIRQRILHFILPSFLLLLMFHVIPIFMTAGYSFTDYNVLQAPEFVGLSNYKDILKDPYIVSSLINTGIYTIIVVPIQTILSLVIAYILARLFRNRFGNLVRSASLFP